MKIIIKQNKKSKKLSKRIKLLELKMASVQEVLNAAIAEQDAVVAAIQTINSLVDEAKQLIANQNYEGLDQLLVTIQTNSANLVAATMAGTEQVGLLAHPALPNEPSFTEPTV